ncbi:GDP-4-dehydro-6-deoxy-D-mannose reductase [Lysobacter niabensis]|uniref:GDP-4-dehydro-6-deoxy-D-mannose reductase n=1 Tax=Agrilutibacter niabensis TaxID=380628 RepID=A0ABU1VTQ8_9GAMM|nr:GDP-mannose 4,6-dehydratase [Lysobacter niabensis]MDR7100817.1 GDP-4-dehydro-6-deoxy-D-mannose reductase [Lysobacter niabensis]
MVNASGDLRLLVTGAGGFVGRHLVAAFDEGIFGGGELITTPAGFDIRDATQTNELVAAARPNAVIHLAAQSFVPQSFDNPRETIEINLLGTLNLLQALQANGFDGRLVFVSSGDVYGLVPDTALPVDEKRNPEPRNPYAVSKVAAEQLCLQWHRSFGMDVVVVRPFNHVGPGQDRRFVLPALARQVAAIAAGAAAPIIRAGDIDITRDFTDVRDVVAAYASVLRYGTVGRTYVIGSGQERRIRDLLHGMCQIKGIDPAIEQDLEKLRPSEQRRMCADISLIRADTGWTPSISMEQTLMDILVDAEENQ